MQLGEWRKTAPNRECMSNAVLSVLKPVLSDLGAAADPDCWVQWGEDPGIRYLVMVPTRAGLISTAIRVNTGTDGPRATGKLVRWARLQLSELSVESAAGHRIVAVQVEGQVLKGVNAEADRICEFVRGLIAAVDGRDWQFAWDGAPSQPQAGAPRRASASKAAAAKSGARVAAKPSVKPAPKAAASRSAAKAPATPGSAAPKPSTPAKTRVPKPSDAKPSAAKPSAAKPSAAKPSAAKPSDAKPSDAKPSDAKPSDAKPSAAKPTAKRPAAKPAGRQRTASTALVRALGPGTATHPVAELAPAETSRIAPHPIFAPVSTPPASGANAESDEWGDANSEDRADRETRRPKTWAP
jgi:hypothetical protein